MSCIAITTCNFDQWCRYGQRMAKTFSKHWPRDIKLRIYAEGFAAEPSDRWECMQLKQEAPWLQEFKARYSEPRYRGHMYEKYSYLYDAVKFAHKIAAIGAASDDTDADILIWMDADVVTHAPVTIDWLEELFPPETSLAWLDRSYKHLECGFMMFRLPQAKDVIEEFVEMYRTGDIFSLQHWTDCHVIEHVGRKAEERGDIAIQSLSGDKDTYRHPFINGRLGERMDHLKGDRKLVGKSLDTDLKRPRPEPYWQ